MPIYEYACQECGHQFEKIQRMSDDPLKECPNCHKEALKKLVSAAGFRLKGGGWYETDFKNSSKKSGTEGKKDEKTTSDSSSKSETKPASSSSGEKAS